MQFAEVNQHYAALQQEFQSGAISAEQFDEALKAMMVQDERGRWWAKARETGEWNYYDNVTNAWVRADPPMAAASSAPPPPPLPSSPSSPSSPPSYGGSQPQTALLPPSGGQPPAQPYPPAPYPSGPVGGGTMAGGELSAGMKVVFYLVSFFVPIAGIVLFFVYRGKPDAGDRQAATVFLVLGLLSLGFCMCSVFGLLMSNSMVYY